MKQPKNALHPRGHSDDWLIPSGAITTMNALTIDKLVYIAEAETRRMAWRVFMRRGLNAQMRSPGLTVVFDEKY